MGLNPEEAERAVPAFLEPGDAARRAALCRSLDSVGQGYARPFIRRLQQNQGAATVVVEALRGGMADPDANEHLKQGVASVLTLLQKV